MIRIFDEEEGKIVDVTGVWWWNPEDGVVVKCQDTHIDGLLPWVGEEKDRQLMIHGELMELAMTPATWVPADLHGGVRQRRMTR
jgi:hypothetical protein